MEDYHEDLIIVHTMASQINSLHESLPLSYNFQSDVTKMIQKLLDEQNILRQEVFLLRTSMGTFLPQESVPENTKGKVTDKQVDSKSTEEKPSTYASIAKPTSKEPTNKGKQASRSNYRQRSKSKSDRRRNERSSQDHRERSSQDRRERSIRRHDRSIRRYRERSTQRSRSNTAPRHTREGHRDQRRVPTPAYKRPNYHQNTARGRNNFAHSYFPRYPRNQQPWYHPSHQRNSRNDFRIGEHEQYQRNFPEFYHQPARHFKHWESRPTFDRKSYEMYRNHNLYNVDVSNRYEILGN